MNTRLLLPLLGLLFLLHGKAQAQIFGTETIFLCATETNFEDRRDYLEVCTNTCNDDDLRGCPGEGCGNCDKYLEKIDPGAPVAVSTEIIYRDFVGLQLKDSTRFIINVTDPNWFGETVVRAYSTRTELECERRVLGICVDRTCRTKDPDHLRDYIIKRYKKNFEHYADIVDQTLIAIKNTISGNTSIIVPIISNKTCQEVEIAPGVTVTVCSEIQDQGGDYDGLTVADEYRLEIFQNGSWQTLVTSSGTPPASLSFSLPGLDFGQYPIRFSQRSDCNGDEWWEQEGTINVVPSCYNDNTASLAIGNAKELLPNFPSTFLIEEIGTYPIILTGLTDFDEHYEMVLDGEEEFIQLDAVAKNITVTNDIGNVYKLFINRKPGRETCLGSVPIDPGGNSVAIATLTIMVNGAPLEVDQLCPVILPMDLYTAGDSADNVLITEVFPVQATSARRVIVKPGMVLASGATLTLQILDDEAGLPASNEQENYVLQKTYDEFGRMTGAAMTYFDGMGRPVQNQYVDIGTGQFMTSETLYDGFGRSSINTLTAPTGENPVDADCPDFPLEENAWVAFERKPDFVTTADGSDLQAAAIEAGNAVPVVQGPAGTLGHYYSTASPEPLVANTQYPFVQEVPENDGTGAIRSTVPPGDFYRDNGTPRNVASVEQKKVYFQAGSYDRTVLDEYLSLFAEEFPSRNLSLDIINERFAKSEYTDADGRKSHVYQDREGRQVANSIEVTQGLLASYVLHDTRGRLVAGITPNGASQFRSGVPYDSIDKTTYEYNFEGFLLAMNETDAGRTEYRYARDGRIRFSQNAEQRERGAYSYTDYDQALRPIESGELTNMAGTAYQWDSPDLLAMLDAFGEPGQVPAGGTRKQYVITTKYDLPAQLPGGYTHLDQHFVTGNVSSTGYNTFPGGNGQTSKTYYSYDERGRVDWMLQEISGLGSKLLEYTYDAAGNVKEVAYQRDSADQYYHYYEYDKDIRLAHVFSGTTAPQYNALLEITNRTALTQQATYHYYLHGPLQRMVLPAVQQGLDYTYTIDGKLKAINGYDPSADPGNDNNDAFGMSLDYHANDYRSAGVAVQTGMSNLPAGAKEQYSGNIRTQKWHSPVDGNQTKAYAYSYDQRQQLTDADFGAVDIQANAFVASPDYRVDVPGYDDNGNIERLVRNGENGRVLHDLTYQYEPKTNRLDKVLQGDTVLLDYTYNALGQLVEQRRGAEAMYMTYDVTGKVTAVHKDEARSTAIVTFDYDDRGFRLSKTTYDSLHQPAWKTWYVRDGSGAVLSIYVQNLTAAGEPIQYEVPVYGSGRVGMYRPLDQANYYELKDHLGNVRVVIGGSTSVDYLATMEAYRDSLENPYFERNKVVTVADHLNHTPDSLANKAVRINNVLDQEPNAVGAGITLRVFPGDTLRAQVFAKYEDFDNSTNNVIPALAGYLGTVFGVPGVGENPISPFDVVDDPSFLSLEAWNQFDDQQPRLYLNYLLYDNNFNLVDFGFDQVSEAARIPTDTALLAGHAFEKLMLELVTEQAGFVYIYVSNENDQNVTAYFDDLGVEHTYGNIAVATDRYPFGLAMAGRELERIKWRYGYQGDFAEEDEETGWNSFELRNYDAVIGRWLTVDPMLVGFSPYIGMANNPVSSVDPDGGKPFDYFQNADGHTVWVNSSESTWTDSNGEVYQNIGTEYIDFNGDFITFHGQTDFGDFLKPWSVVIDAVSGRPQSDGTFDYSFENQFNKGVGQLPEGQYWVNPQKIQNWSDLSTANQIASLLGRGAMPGGPRSWGQQRVWINPQEVTLVTPQGDTIIRNGFSIHGGSTPGSAGCIDCHKNAPLFFKLLERSTATKVFLNVHYGIQR